MTEDLNIYILEHWGLEKFVVGYVVAAKSEEEARFLANQEDRKDPSHPNSGLYLNDGKCIFAGKSNQNSSGIIARGEKSRLIEHIPKYSALLPILKLMEGLMDSQVHPKIAECILKAGLECISTVILEVSKAERNLYGIDYLIKYQNQYYLSENSIYIFSPPKNQQSYNLQWEDTCHILLKIKPINLSLSPIDLIQLTPAAKIALIKAVDDSLWLDRENSMSYESVCDLDL